MSTPNVTIKITPASAANSNGIYDVAITNAGSTQLPLSTFSGWSVNDALTGVAQEFTANVYSSYDFNGLMTAVPSSFTENYTNPLALRLARVNWIFNQAYPSQLANDGQYYTDGDIQLALWTLWGTPISPANSAALGAYSQARVDQIVAAATSTVNFGNYPALNFYPGTEQTIALVFDPVDANGVHQAPIFSPIQAAAVSGVLWGDINSNGIKDPGEAPIPEFNITVSVGHDLNDDGDISDAGEIVAEASQFNGVYAIPGLLPGITYQMQFAKPDGTVFSPANAGNGSNDSDVSATGNSSTFVLTPGENKQNVDAGIIRPGLDPAALGGRVWADGNDNGIQDPGELGVAGVKVTLLDVYNHVNPSFTASVYTDAEGKYQFTNLTPSLYNVQFDKATLPVNHHFIRQFQGADTTADSNANQYDGWAYTINLSSGQSDLTIDAGISASKGSIGDKVWLDTLPPHAGVGGLTAPGVAGVTVSLYELGADYVLGTPDDVLLGTQVTDANGNYKFTDLADGAYEVVFSNIGADYRFTNRIYGGNQEDVSHVDPLTGQSGPIYLEYGAQITNIDAGIRDKFASISGWAWQDNDGDGYQFENLYIENSLVGIAGMTVNLYQAGADNSFGTSDDVLAATQTTDDKGKYGFANLAAGQYQVEFSLADATNTVFTTLATGPEVTDHFGGGDTAAAMKEWDSDADTVTGRTGIIDVVDFQDVSKIDAGVTGRDTVIGDRVWEDLNYDGVQSPGEPGLANVRVALFNTYYQVLAETFTDANGQYAFHNLNADTYVVAVTAPDGYYFTRQGAFGNSMLDANSVVNALGQTGMINLNAWRKALNVDAGLYRQITTNGRVWNDLNQNGIQEAGENGIAGATVTAVTPYWQQMAATVTDADGNYSLALNPGDYRLSFQTTSGYTFSPAKQGSDPALDSDVTEPSYTSVFTVNSGDQPLDFDAGFYQHTDITYQLGDRIWEDENCNGIQDGGEWNKGIANVSVDLLDANGNVVASTVTDSGGQYLFGNLVDGAYKIHVHAPAGYFFTVADKPDIFANSVFDSNGDSKLLNLSAGDYGYNKDAGLYRKGAIGSTVWNDQNQNGIQDAGENGMAGVTVKLVDISHYNTFIRTTVTDANGHYGFDSIDLDNYAVKVYAPAGYEYTQALVGTDAMLDSNVDDKGFSTPINNWVSGFQALNVDAGLIYAPEKPKVQDRVWHDQNLNGLQDAGEAGIAGVTVKLLDSSLENVLLQSVLTDANGYYRFDNVDFGHYTVQVVAPSGYEFTYMGQDTNSYEDPDTDSDVDYSGYSTFINAWNFAGEALNVDAGLYDASHTATIGDRVWEDANCNGIQDDGEWNKGLAEVSVQLQNADGVVIAGTLTDNNGHYDFKNVAPGTYKVHVDASTGYYPTQANQDGGVLGNSVIDNAGNSALITVAAGDKYSAADAGFYSKATFGDLVWHDVNQNGMQDADESGMAGVTVNLLNASDANSLLRSVLTDSSGHYQFSDVDLGNYTIQVVAPAGFAYTSQFAGTDSSIDSNVDSNGQTIPINAWISGIQELSLDAGLIDLPLVSAALSTLSSGNSELVFGNTTPVLIAGDLASAGDVYANAANAVAEPSSLEAVAYDIPLLTLTGSPVVAYL